MTTTTKTDQSQWEGLWLHFAMLKVSLQKRYIRKLLHLFVRMWLTKEANIPVKFARCRAVMC